MWMLVAQAGGAGSFLGALVLPLGLLAVMYFLVLRPQQQQLQKARDFRASLKAGDRIITSGGFYGTIVSFDGDVVHLQLSPGTRVKCRRDQIVERQDDGTEATESTSESSEKSSEKSTKKGA
jgi:preprotein translocase subunit YajC